MRVSVAGAQQILADLNFDTERKNVRSAHVLLALLQLKPEGEWKTATAPLLGTRAIMDWIRDVYSVDYKPNTRETIRRQTLHQFVEAGLVEENPDDPTRPVNSPKWCYRITQEALLLIRQFGGRKYSKELRAYLDAIPGLRTMYQAARKMQRIPVVLSNNETLLLSPGGQNVLIKQMVDEFCSMFTPGGVVLYVGDADAKWAYFDEEVLRELGVVVDSHGKMPDLVVFLEEKNWLVLLEAAASHGPINAKRHGELKRLFDGAKAGLVFVTCLPSRVELRKYLAEIAWETEVWCADDPTHLVHFNGEKFLGPYEKSER